MYFFLAFVVLGLAGRGMAPGLGKWLGNWQRDSLEVWRAIGIITAAIGFVIVGHDWDHMAYWLTFAACAWLGILAHRELARRGGFDKQLSERSDQLRRVSEKMQQLASGASGKAPSTTTGARVDDITDQAAALVKEAASSIDETAAATDEARTSYPATIAEIQSNDPQRSARESAEVFLDVGDGLIRVRTVRSEGKLQPAMHAEQQPPAAAAVSAASAASTGEAAARQAEVATVAESAEDVAKETGGQPVAMAVHEPPQATASEPSNPAGYKSGPSNPPGYKAGPVQLNRGIDSIFSSHESPVRPTIYGPLKTVGEQHVDHEVDMSRMPVSEDQLKRNNAGKAAAAKVAAERAASGKK